MSDDAPETILNRLCKRFGVEPDVPEPPLSEPYRADSAQVFGECTNLESSDAGYHLRAPEGAEYELEATAIDEERGSPGTNIDAERIRPAVGKYGPTVVRGSYGDWGLYEKHFRSEPQIFDPITSTTAVLKMARYEAQPPETVNPSHESALSDFVDWSNAWLHSIAGGLGEMVAETGQTLMIYGPCLREVLWGLDDDGRRHPVKLGYREPGSYEGWVLSERMDALEAVKFRSLDDAFLLPNGDQIKVTPPTAKLYHAAINDRGHNFAGIPPTRPAIFWHKLKKLLGQIAALTADKYGVPVAKVMDVPVDVDSEFVQAPSGSADDQDKSDLFYDVVNFRAGEAPTVEIPAGLDIEYEGPPGQMPKLMELIQYCDQQIAQPFKNEGSLLGLQQATGSYAQASVKDDQFLRYAPTIAHDVLQPLNRLIRLTAQAYLEPEIGEPLPNYPTVQMRLDGLTDASAWLEQVIQAMGGRPMTAWPEGLQRAALEKLNLPEDALEESEDETEVAGTGEVEYGEASQPPADDGTRQKTPIDEEQAPDEVAA